MSYFVYQITNILNGKIYVGAHKGEPDDGYMGSGTHISRAIKKYGLQNFKKEILKECATQEEMYLEEAKIVTQEFVDREDTYNITLGGYGSFNHINSDPTIKSEACRRALVTIRSKPKEELDRIYKSRGLPGDKNYWFGKNRSGENNPRFGCIVDQQTRDKIGAVNKKLVEAGLVDYSNNKGATTAEGRQRISDCNSREFRFIDPDGNIVVFKNLAKFCKEHGLSEGSMGHVNKGRNKQHKGWRKA